MKTKIQTMNYKGKQVETKIGQSQYLINKPVFDRTEIAIEDVPMNENLKRAFKILSEGDGEPFFFISEMKLGENHPTAYDDIMTKEWGESFISYLDKAPFPMSALGHTNVDKPFERVESHGYVFGGKVQDESMFLLNYLLPGKTDKTKEFSSKTRKEIQSGMLSTSISNMQRYVKLQDEDTMEAKWYVVESMQGQRNDIVEHDLTGSDAAIVARSYKTSEKTEEKSVVKNQGEQSMDKMEMLKKLGVLKTNGDLTNVEIAKHFGLELVTAEHNSAMSSLKAITDELGEGKPLEIIASLKEKSSRVDTAEFDSRKEKALEAQFKDETIRGYAKELFVLKSGTKEECEAEATRVSELKVLKDFASKLAADMSKGTNFSSENTKTDSSSMEM